MGRIDWIPIEEIPEVLKDGRDVLLWEADEGETGRAAVGKFTGDSWYCACYDFQSIWKPTHFAEINAPEAGLPLAKS